MDTGRASGSYGGKMHSPKEVDDFAAKVGIAIIVIFILFVIGGFLAKS